MCFEKGVHSLVRRNSNTASTAARVAACSSFSRFLVLGDGDILGFPPSPPPEEVVVDSSAGWWLVSMGGGTLFVEDDAVACSVPPPGVDSSTSCGKLVMSSGLGCVGPSAGMTIGDG